MTIQSTVKGEHTDVLTYWTIQVQAEAGEVVMSLTEGYEDAQVLFKTKAEVNNLISLLTTFRDLAFP